MKTALQQATEPAVANALAARAACYHQNFPAFFAAYRASPALGRAILDAIVLSTRWTALNVLMKACKPSVPVAA
eukprot:CAMPEP_0119110592 /NCGR_PEP_ID=MMETSP1180-20130426/30648_1 /TAXON_ID=3052 ORGANISM="Chlamydomonas cf sp, Strain CCMP681" /NCGR_SAMPLE_ID=MMETSP1180 /ASSEMBLY_ACC=CAM_ASM_000741 /LENGTH=73 /DNA_ID=CAMNT_0007097021 /DNA_START=39 /DNA_END=256 /DNA_ORIENTATION=+